MESPRLSVLVRELTAAWVSMARGHSTPFFTAFMTKATKKETVVPGTTASNQQPEVSASPAEKRRPLKTLSLADVSLSIWPNDRIVKGQATRFYSITIERSYRDRDGQYRWSRSVNPGDLAPLMSLCQQAGQYINEQQGLVPATDED